MNNLLNIRSIVYGGLDGIITMFNIAAGSTGAKLDNKIVIILGLSTLVADAVSMAVSDYMSTKASQTKENPKINAINTFIAFVIFGAIPLYTFILMNGKENVFFKSSISAMIAMFILGSIKSKYTQQKWYISGLVTIFYGMMASLISYNIGSYVSKIIK